MTECKGPETERILSMYAKFVEEKSEKDPTFKLWTQYIEDVKILLEFIRATRTGNFKDHLKWLEEMVKAFFLYDRVNYARYITAYLREMDSLWFTHPLPGNT